MPEEILLNRTEMVEILDELGKIVKEFMDTIAPKCDALTKKDYYTKGKAMDVMDSYHQAILKTNDLGQLYSSSLMAVLDILDKMSQQDKELAALLSELVTESKGG
ncbi:hypothetical protein HB825_10440 [Listeria booriae]|uniref:hypothetical protein n=1 Tax=Listeria booriae TaxID=1552123 RepID=UPI00164DC014|nr:hypothetical protein [Listeria booriae]MBC6135251.1 hypothetical protein [Listeria booriae]